MKKIIIIVLIILILLVILLTYFNNKESFLADIFELTNVDGESNTATIEFSNTPPRCIPYDEPYTGQNNKGFYGLMCNTDTSINDLSKSCPGNLNTPSSKYYKKEINNKPLNKYGGWQHCTPYLENITDKYQASTLLITDKLWNIYKLAGGKKQRPSEQIKIAVGCGNMGVKSHHSPQELPYYQRPKDYTAPKNGVAFTLNDAAYHCNYLGDKCAGFNYDAPWSMANSQYYENQGNQNNNANYQIYSSLPTPTFESTFLKPGSNIDQITTAESIPWKWPGAPQAFVQQIDSAIEKNGIQSNNLIWEHCWVKNKATTTQSPSALQGDINQSSQHITRLNNTIDQLQNQLKAVNATSSISSAENINMINQFSGQVVSEIHGSLDSIKLDIQNMENINKIEIEDKINSIQRLIQNISDLEKEDIASLHSSVEDLHKNIEDVTKSFNSLLLSDKLTRDNKIKNNFKKLITLILNYKNLVPNVIEAQRNGIIKKKLLCETSTDCNLEYCKLSNDEYPNLYTCSLDYSNIKNALKDDLERLENSY